MFCFSFYEREQLKRRTECCKTVPLAGVYPLRHIHPRNLFPQAGPEQTKIHINFNVNFKNFIRMHKNKSTLTDFRKLEKKITISTWTPQECPSSCRGWGTSFHVHFRAHPLALAKELKK